MSWTKKYWDLVEHLYWSPQYIGLKSIPQRHWTIDGDIVSVPKEMTNPRGPLYRRLRSGEDYETYVHRQEETFNHIFDLTFAITPGDIIGEVFGPLTSAGPDHSYQSLGRELRTRHFWGEHDNITHPDGFFVAENSILAVELKFNAKTSLDQLAKYVLLIVAEEMVEGRRDSLDLLYVFNSDPNDSFERQTSIEPDAVNETLFDALSRSVRKTKIRSFLHDNEAKFRDVLNRLSVRCISWKDFADALLDYSEALSESRGDRTLQRLILGLKTEITGHPLSNAISVEE